MARSKIGGAFGMLRGSIGSVTYSIKKTTSGKTEQIARQKAQSVSNPQTTAQILQRMKLGPAQRFYDAFENVVAKGILSHAFEAIPYGNASRQHFISLAMKEEAAVYVPKGVDFFVPGEYVVSEGSLASISYFNQLTAGEAAQNELLCNFNGVALTAEAIEAFVGEGYEQGMQLTLIGTKVTAAGRYEPFATRILMSVGNTTDNPIDVQLYDHGAVVVGDNKIAAIAIIVSKGSQEANDYRSTQKMKFVNGFESLKSIEALEAAIRSYQDNETHNSLNSEWYLNQDNGQAFNGRVTQMHVAWPDSEHGDVDDDFFVGLQTNGSYVDLTIFTSDGTGAGQIYIVRDESGALDPCTYDDGVTPVTGAAMRSALIAEGWAGQIFFKQATAAIAAQGGFTLGA